MNLHSELKIKTSEGILFSYILAGPVTRCMAWLIDSVLVLLLSRCVVVGLAAWGLIGDDPFAQAEVQFAAFFIIGVFYGIAFEWALRGQTWGKRMFRLRVMDLRGLRLQFHQVVLRNLVRPIDSLPICYLVGGLACLSSRRAQRLGDLAAGTVVIQLPKFAEPDLEQLLAGKYNSLRDFPHLGARLRQRVSPAEARLALQALVRREEIESEARVTLFTELAQYFKAIVVFPSEAVEGVPDEQYIRNVVDILFRGRAAVQAEGEAASVRRTARVLSEVAQ